MRARPRFKRNSPSGGQGLPGLQVGGVSRPREYATINNIEDERSFQMLKLRSIGLNDYRVLEDRKRIGRIRFADERLPGVWLWSITVPLSGDLPTGSFPALVGSRGPWQSRDRSAGEKGLSLVESKRRDGEDSTGWLGAAGFAPGTVRPCLYDPAGCSPAADRRRTPTSGRDTRPPAGLSFPRTPLPCDRSPASGWYA
jgi:hypothetical protein